MLPKTRRRGRAEGPAAGTCGRAKGPDDCLAAGVLADRVDSSEYDDLLRWLRATAAQAIDEHVNARGRCASCHRGWPCDAACRADFILGAL